MLEDSVRLLREPNRTKETVGQALDELGKLLQGLPPAIKAPLFFVCKTRRASAASLPFGVRWPFPLNR